MKKCVWIVKSSETYSSDIQYQQVFFLQFCLKIHIKLFIACDFFSGIRMDGFDIETIQ